MGCLQGSISLLGKRLSGRVGLLSESLQGRATLIGELLSGEATLASRPLRGNAALLGERLRGRVGLVCKVDRTPYLEVKPEVVWLTDINDFMADFDIYSNVEWEIEEEDAPMSNASPISNMSMLRNDK